MDSFECSFSLVEEVIAQMNFISDERRSAFSSRLKHFQRLKYPVGINTGRGVAAIYRARHLLLMALAVSVAAFLHIAKTHTGESAAAQVGFV